MNSKVKGDIAVGQAIAYYLSQQKEVCLPIGDKQKYDLIVDDGHSFQKIQCKYTSVLSEYGIYEVPLRVLGGNQSFHTAKKYDKSDFDILFAVTSNGDKYEIPFKEVTSKSSVSLGKKYEKFKITGLGGIPHDGL